MNKGIKIILFVLFTFITVILTTTAVYYAATADIKLQTDKLIDYGKSIEIYDNEGNKIESASVTAKRKSVSLNELQEHTINAFIASEDRNFFKHNGLNYKRMVKAAFKNISSRSFKEGASTISQQLIKNTHLTGDKTISRKLKEIRLTKQLEKKYSKSEILEMYLNTIYFGHNCYGLQSAANFYFGKDAENLTVDESATVAGLLTSPNNLSPFKNAEKCLNRRNIVLKSMLECNYLDETAYQNAKSTPLTAQKSNGNYYCSDYISAVFDELEELDIGAFSDICDYKIYTFMDEKLQNHIADLEFECDNGIFVREKNGGIAAFQSELGLIKRQIGSTAKPIFVYAPAINENKLNMCTKINDEPINYAGYSPENYDKKYHGKVTVAESLIKSLNIPAVKALNYTGIDVVEKYADVMNVHIDEGDKNLALALGGMQHGLTIKQLCDCYSTFQNNGEFTQSHFIKRITDKHGQTIYSAESNKRKVFNEGTCSLINDVLCEVSKSGTAKKLKNLNYDVACKTGTCGDESGNTDAYAIGYTSDYCIGVWLGSSKNEKLQIYGGNQSCQTLKEILNNIYSTETPSPLDKTSGTVEYEIDREEYEKNEKLIVADSYSPKLNKLKVKLLSKNPIIGTSTRFERPVIQKPQIIANKNNISIQLCQTKYYSYIVNRQNNGKTEKIYDGAWVNEILDTPQKGSYVYTVIPYFDDGKTIHLGEAVELPQIIFDYSESENKTPDIAYKDWYNQ